MEIEEKKLREILDDYQAQTDRTLNTYQMQTDQKIDGLKDDIERYIGVLKEDFDHQLQTVLEYVKDVPAIKEKQDIMFDQMGVMTEDIAVIKEAVKDHEVRLQKIEAR